MSLTGQGYYTYGEAEDENSFKPCSRSHKAKDHIATIDHDTSKQVRLQTENQQRSISKSVTKFDNVLKRQEGAPISCTLHTRQSSQDLRSKQIYHKMKNEGCVSNKDHKTKKDSEEDVTNNSWSIPVRNNGELYNGNNVALNDSHKCCKKKYKSVKIVKNGKGEVPFYPDSPTKPTGWPYLNYIIAILLFTLTVIAFVIVIAWLYIPVLNAKAVNNQTVSPMPMKTKM